MTVLESLIRALDEFDYWLAKGYSARSAHVGASPQLDLLANEVVQIVRGLDGHNRVRFGRDGELLASWRSASHVVAAPRTVEDQGSAA